MGFPFATTTVAVAGDCDSKVAVGPARVGAGTVDVGEIATGTAVGVESNVRQLKIARFRTMKTKKILFFKGDS